MKNLTMVFGKATQCHHTSRTVLLRH